MNRRFFKTLAAAAVVTGAAASVASAQFVITPFKLRGDPAPGMTGNHFNFDRPNINDAGSIAFAGDTDNPTTSADDFVYVNDVLKAREGDPAPGVPGGVYGTFSIFDSGQHLNAVGDVIYESSLTGVPTTENLTLFTSIGGVATPVAREGTPAAGIPDRTYSLFNFPALFNNGNYGFVTDLAGTSTTDDSVIYRGATPIYREGTQVPFLPAGTTWDGTFTEAEWNGAGQLLFVGNTNAATNDQIMVRDTNGVAEVIIREGDTIQANGGPDTLESWLQLALAENGKWGFRGTLAGQGTLSDSFVLTQDGFFRQEGEAVPELGAGVTTGNFNGVDVNSGGDVVSLSDILGAADPNVDEGIFFNDTLVVTDGTQVPGLPAGTLFSDLDFEDLNINDAGVIVFGASYTGTVIGDGIFTAVVPEPGSAGLVVGGAVCLAARRRRRGA